MSTWHICLIKAFVGGGTIRLVDIAVPSDDAYERNGEKESKDLVE